MALNISGRERGFRALPDTCRFRGIVVRLPFVCTIQCVLRMFFVESIAPTIYIRSTGRSRMSRVEL